MAEKDTFSIERSATIDAPATAVYERLADFHRWAEWSPWEELDPDMARTFSGAEAGKGAVYEWSGNKKAGAGRMEILDVEAPTLVSVDLRFLKPFKAHNATRFELVEEAGSTTVRWVMTGPKTFMTRVMGVFKSMDAMVGPDFEKGLAKLKVAAEG